MAVLGQSSVQALAYLQRLSGVRTGKKLYGVPICLCCLSSSLELNSKLKLSGEVTVI